MVGELSLDGTLQPIKGALPIAIRARAEKFKGLLLPKANEREAAVVNNLDVYGMENIIDVVNFLSGKSQFQPTVIDTRNQSGRVPTDGNLMILTAQTYCSSASDTVVVGGFDGFGCGKTVGTVQIYGI